MNKFMTKVISAAISTVMVMGTAMSVSAEKITVEPDYPIHGNKCGELVLSPEINRDIYVKITQYSPDGDYVYYNSVIPAVGAASGDNDYSFILEGKDDVSYDVSIGVHKYNISSEPLLYTYEFTVKDTDNITNETVSGYLYSFKITGSEDFKEPTVLESTSAEKNEQNVIALSKTVSFPVSEGIPGDVNFDSSVDLHDAIEIAKYLLDNSRFTAEQLKAGDFNGNGKVDLHDAVGIAKSLLKK